jgi:starch phosphorylase
MEAVEQYEQNRWKFTVTLDLEENGPFGYTVRVLPRHHGLITPVELGLQAVPDAASGMTDGPLR